jgi:hypothetical protein
MGKCEKYMLLCLKRKGSQTKKKPATKKNLLLEQLASTKNNMSQFDANKNGSQLLSAQAHRHCTKYRALLLAHVRKQI